MSKEPGINREREELGEILGKIDFENMKWERKMRDYEDNKKTYETYFEIGLGCVISTCVFWYIKERWYK